MCFASRIALSSLALLVPSLLKCLNIDLRLVDCSIFTTRQPHDKHSPAHPSLIAHRPSHQEATRSIPFTWSSETATTCTTPGPPLFLPRCLPNPCPATGTPVESIFQQVLKKVGLTARYNCNCLEGIEPPTRVHCHSCNLDSAPPCTWQYAVILAMTFAMWLPSYIL